MAENKAPKVFVVLPVYNRINETKAFLQSVCRQTYSNFVTVVCDDGSTDGTSEYIRQHHPDVVVLSGDGNLWWTKGINRCIEYALSHCRENDFILTINNDSIISPDYIKQKVERASTHINSIIGSMGVFMDNPDLIETSGWVVDFIKCRGISLTKPGEKRTKNHSGIVEVSYLPGKGVLFPVAVFQRIGLFDAKHFPQYHADTDLILSAHEAGYKVYLDYDSVVYSDVNTKNMVLPDQRMTIGDIIKTFKGPYSVSNFQVYKSFAEKHFPDKQIRFLVTAYIRTFGGLSLRYFRDRVRRLTG